MKINMKGNSKKVRNMGKGSTIGQMETITMESGKMIALRVKEPL